MHALRFERSRLWLVLPGTALLAALAVALQPGRPIAATVALALIGVVGVLLRAAPAALRLLRRHRALLLLVVLAGLLIAWIAAGVRMASGPWPGYYPTAANGRPLTPGFEQTLQLYIAAAGSTVSSPWRIGGLPLLPLVLAMICAAGGFVLVGDAARVQLGFARPPRSVWHWLNARPSRGGRAVARAVSGLVLIGVAAFLAIGLVSRYTVNGYTGDHPVREMVGIVAVAAGAALLIASPVAIGLSMRLDFDKEHRVREQERLRVAAHLHDSVLQTLALIQRQAADPSAVARLARRQEHALRAWMAGEVDLGSATLAVAVRDLVDDAQDEQAMKAELSAIGDMTLDSRGEELTAAAREVLRNASRHAPGAAVTVFLDVGEGGAELFIRDDGPGFEVDAVPTERRGLRDSVIGRMRSVGGSATVESSPGEGTEVALRLPADQSGK